LYLSCMIFLSLFQRYTNYRSLSLLQLCLFFFSYVRIECIQFTLVHRIQHTVQYGIVIQYQRKFCQTWSINFQLLQLYFMLKRKICKFAHFRVVQIQSPEIYKFVRLKLSKNFPLKHIYLLVNLGNGMFHFKELRVQLCLRF
jgi:hypothetical protein